MDKNRKLKIRKSAILKNGQGSKSKVKLSSSLKSLSPEELSFRPMIYPQDREELKEIRQRYGMDIFNNNCRRNLVRPIICFKNREEQERMLKDSDTDISKVKAVIKVKSALCQKNPLPPTESKNKIEPGNIAKDVKKNVSSDAISKNVKSKDKPSTEIKKRKTSKKVKIKDKPESDTQNENKSEKEDQRKTEYRFKTNSILVGDAFVKMGWVREPIDGDNWDIHWSEISWLNKYFGPDGGIPLLPHQRILHFRNCVEMTKKNLMVKNLKTLRTCFLKAVGKEYAAEIDFTPQTFLLPREHFAFLRTMRKDPGSIWILKPSSGAQGKGITLIDSEDKYTVWRENNDVQYKNLIDRRKEREKGELKALKRSKFPSTANIAAVEIMEDLFEKVTVKKPRRKKLDKTNIMQVEKFVAQRYIAQPYLLCGHKFDIRFYVLVTSFFPLKAYMYREGFIRMTESVYSLDDLSDLKCHLTNVAIQKRNAFFSPFQKPTKPMKFSVHCLFGLIRNTYGHLEVAKIRNGIDTIVIRTLQSVEKLVYQDNHCFDVYGFDVILDSDLKPWLLEVNAAPSLKPSDAKDFRLKIHLIQDTISVLNLDNRLSGKEKRVGGYDLFWNEGPVYAAIDEDELRDTFYGRLPRLNTHLGGYYLDRQDQLRKIFDAHSLRLANAQIKNTQMSNPGTANGKNQINQYFQVEGNTQSSHAKMNRMRSK